MPYGRMPAGVRHHDRRRALRSGPPLPPVSFAPCACPTCSLPRSVTTPRTRRCRPTACCCGRGTCASWAPGIYSLLPLGFRANKRVEQVIREELNAIGGQEMEMPVVHPADLWRESGRYDAIGPEMARFKDRGERDMVLAMTHEEVVADLLRDIVRSYRQLPFIVYHFQTKFRDEPRSRGGLIRVREFVMKDSYSCDRDEAGLDVAYWAHHAAYTRIFERLGLHAIAVSSDVGMMGGSLAHEFMVLNPAGEDVLVICEACEYASNRQIAPTVAPEPEAEDLLPGRGGRDAGRHDDRRAGDLPRRPRSRGPPRRRSSSPATGGSSSRSCAATTRSTRPSS